LYGDADAITRNYAEKAGLTVIMSGPEDIISNGSRTLVTGNGHPLMGAVSGTGCMAASVTGVYNAVSRDRVTASAAALAAFGIAGEKAAERAAGPGSFKTALFDALSSLTPEDLGKYARIREI
jgi:hydroxyethylthiazole kinase